MNVHVTDPGKVCTIDLLAASEKTAGSASRGTRSEGCWRAMLDAALQQASLPAEFVGP